MIWYTKDKAETLTYDLTGVHHLSQGELTFWGTPEEWVSRISQRFQKYTDSRMVPFAVLPYSQPLDIRRIPSLYNNATLRNMTGHIVLFDMLRQLKKARDSLGVVTGGGGNPLEEGNSVKIRASCSQADALSFTAEPIAATTCPLALNFRLHPLPKGYTKEMLESYEAELSNPSGIPIISPGNLEMEGVGVFDECGIAFGLHGGEGMK